MISFDIFDTLITRKTYSPQGIFLLLQEKLLATNINTNITDFCKNFCTLRVSAEKDARLYAEQEGREEITLHEIYDLLAKRNNIPKELVSEIKEWEIEEEIENTYPIKYNINILKKFLSDGEYVVLISDMYLDRNSIRKILLKADPVFREIPIYVSSEIYKTKYSGSLFFEVAKIESKNFSDWVHFGDNKVSDYLMPRLLGIEPKYVPFEGLTSWENQLGEELGLKNNLILQIYFGIARNIRLESKLSRPGQIGASIGGMILYPYVLWLIHRAMEIGINRLYFIARDGYILKKIADLIINNQKLNIHTKYIYGSRKAWRLNELSEEDKKKVIMYLSQEVDFSDSNFAFIDLHGTGATMACLADVIIEYYNVETKVFYFDLMKNEVNRSYLFMPFCSEHSAIIELFCRAPHGATIGYDYEETKIIPRIQPVDSIYWKKAGLFDYFYGVELFADRISQCYQGYWLENIGLVESVLEYCKKTPCQELQEFMGNMPHNDGVEDEEIQYAPILSLKDIFGLYMLRTIEDISKYYSGVNLKLSLLRTGHKYDKEISFLEKNYNNILGKCIHKLKNRRYRKKKCQNVVIYAAGDIGKRLYGHLSTIPGFHVNAWTDIDYERYMQIGYPVVSLQEALKSDFHYIIIALSNNHICMSVQRILEGLGIESEKIVSYKEFLEEYMI